MELSPSEYQPCPLQFYDFKQLDHKKNCTIYSSVAQRQDVITLEELESLHAELMILKETVQNRIQLLTSEIGVLNDWQVKRKRRHSDASETASSLGRPPKSHPSHHQAQDHTSHSKRQKMNQVGGTLTSEEQLLKKPKIKGGKSKGHVTEVPVERDTAPLESALIKSKTEGADKFWTSLEPYFSDITDSDLDNLHIGSLLDQSLFEVPPLGRHYSQQWALEDLADEGQETGKLLGHRMSKDVWQNEANSLLNDGITSNKVNQISSYGPLTQKLMATFLDDTNSKQFHRKMEPSSSTVSPSVLEMRIKEELTTLGLLDPSEPQREPQDNEDDEIVRELKKAQVDLKIVHEYNQQQKRMLQSLAKSEMKRQDVRRQLHEADQEVMEWLRRFVGYRQRKKREPIRLKEKEGAQKSLEKRQRLVQHLLV